MIPAPTADQINQFAAAFDAAWARLQRMTVRELRLHVPSNGAVIVRHAIGLEFGDAPEDWLRPTLQVADDPDGPSLRLQPLRGRKVELRAAVDQIYYAYVRKWAGLRCEGRPFLLASDEELAAISRVPQQWGSWTPDYMRRLAVQEFAVGELCWRADESAHERLARIAAARAVMSREGTMLPK